jgi:Tol biopolymer transport system component
MNRDGGGIRQLTNRLDEKAMYPLPSPDNTRLAVVDQDTRLISIYDAGDFAKPPEVLAPVPAGVGAAPRATDWSPDGQSLALNGAASVASGIWIYSFDTRSYRRVIASGNSAAWFRRGNRFVYQSEGKLFVSDLSGKSTEVFSVAGESLFSPRLAVDDTQLFFTHGTTTGDIWIVRFEPDRR